MGWDEMSRTASPAPSTSYNSTSSDGTQETYHYPVEEITDNQGPDMRYENGETALMCAAAQGEADEIMQLIQMGSTINLRCFAGRTALMYSCIYGNPVGVHTLLSQRADPNVRCVEGKTALAHLVERGEHMGIHEEVASLLVNKKANMDLQESGGQTALMIAIMSDSPAVVRLLLENGASPDMQDSEGWTALMLCAGENSPIEDEARVRYTELLLQHKADVNIANPQQQTVMTIAIMDAPRSVDGSPAVTAELAEILLQPQYLHLHSEEALSRCDTTCKGPLHWAVTLGYTDLVRMLHEAKADINASTTVVLEDLMNGGQHMGKRKVDNMNALMHVALVEEDNADSIERLIEAGMSCNARTPNNLTALMFAAGRSRVNCLAVLIENNGDPNVEENWGGLTALMLAADAGSTECVQMLLDAGADSRAADKEGHTAEAWARMGVQNLPPGETSGHTAAMQRLQFHECQRVAQDSYHTGICHRTQSSAQDCCRQTVSNSRCCGDHEATVTIGSGSDSPTQGRASQRRKNKGKDRACETCEVCMVQ